MVSERRQLWQCSTALSSLSQQLICLGPVPYQCGDATSVPAATSSTASPDIWHHISSHRLVLTVKFMNGNYQSTFLIPFTTYESAKNQGGLTIRLHRRAEVGLLSLNPEPDERSKDLCLLTSLSYFFFTLSSFLQHVVTRPSQIGTQPPTRGTDVIYSQCLQQ